MKKLLVALALGSTINAAAYAQRPHTDREDDGLKGAVKSVLAVTATLKKPGERYAEGRRVLAERVTYNADGNRAGDELYAGDDGVLAKKSVYRYVRGEKLADGQAITPSVILPGSTGRLGGGMRPISERYKYKYDDKGRVREMTIEEGGRVRFRAVYEYQSGRKETRSYDGGEDALSYRRVDTFDAQGNLAESIEFDPETGQAVFKSSYAAYEFDARGNWVRRLKTESWSGHPEVRKVEYRTITYF